MLTKKTKATIRDAFRTPWVVYMHICGDEIFYVGTGKLSRAFECTRDQRNRYWHDFRAGRPVTVHIQGWYETPQEARRVEYKFIKFLQPVGNGYPSIGRNKGRWLHNGMPELPDEDSTAFVRVPQTLVEVRPGGTQYDSPKAAAKATGISVGAVYNSITGRYPVVQGLSFHKVDNPAYRPPPLVSGAR